MDFQIKHTDINDKDFLMLCKKLNDSENSLVPERANVFDSLKGLDKILSVVLAFDGKTAAGCAALGFVNEETSELKRVFIDEAYRGKGLGKLLSKEIENLAKFKGFKSIMLDTWKPNKSAISVYEKLGYSRIEPQEPDAPLAEKIVFMKKDFCKK